MTCTGHPRASGEHDAVELQPSCDGIAVCPICDFARIECGMPHCHNEAAYWEIAVPTGTIRVSDIGSLLTPYEASPICRDCSPRVASGEKPDGVIALAPIGLIHNVEGL